MYLEIAKKKKKNGTISMGRMGLFSLKENIG